MRMLALCLAVLLAALPAYAQQEGPALLIADSVTVETNNRLVATGNVQALFDGTTLTATSIIYDERTERLIVNGPIHIRQPDGTVLTASQAELDPGFENGLLRSARLVLNEQLQLAAVEAQRVDGRFTQLSRVAVTSCQVCAGETPLWQIRARRVVHDQEEGQIYFDSAQVRVLDLPVAWLPRLRVPDPTNPRARGFLFPQIRSSTLLGFGIKVPYFVPLGDHADITFTPYLSPVTRTLEYRYRQAFVRGDIIVNGALTRDSLVDDEARGYLFAEGAFELDRDFRLTFDGELVSDPSYLSDYDITERDRLDSNLTVSRVRRDEFIEISFTHYESLLDSERNDELVALVGDARVERSYFPRRLGGELRLGAIAHAHYRYSGDDIVGRDVARLHASVGYLNRWTLPGGLRAGAELWGWADRFSIRQDSTSDRLSAQFTPGASLELRWPLVRRSANGARTLIEPIAQIGWVGGDRTPNPNEESTRAELDEANLLSLSRFPAADRRERGRMSALGLRWVREDPTGWSAGLTLGRVYREEEDSDLTRSSGLDGTTSDWLIAGHFNNANGLALQARGLFEEELRFSKAEARASYVAERFDLGATFVLLGRDTAEDRDRALSEWSFDGAYDLNRYWTANANWRYDLAGDRLDRVGLGLDFKNECVDIGFSVSRKFASSINVEPSTSFGLTVELTGFGTGGGASPFRRSCGTTEF